MIGDSHPTASTPGSRYPNLVLPGETAVRAVHLKHLNTIQ